MLRILFCNIAWMDYYKGIVPGKDEPKGGGSYVNENLDAHEKYNFDVVPSFKGSGISRRRILSWICRDKIYER